MARRSSPERPPIEPKSWASVDELDRAIVKLERRISELEALDLRAAAQTHNAAGEVAISNVRQAILEVFGQNSPEYGEHEHIRMWAGPMYVGMSDQEMVAAKEAGCMQVIGILRGLIARLTENREDLESGQAPSPTAYLDYLNLHPRIYEVASDLMRDGYPWEAVFAASKALVNFVKERSNHHDLDGAPLMRTVFSKNSPVLAFNDLSDPTDLDEQEGMMHLFEGVVLGIRNPGGHSFPEGPEQRAVEYLSLISLLAYRVQEAKRG